MEIGASQKPMNNDYQRHVDFGILYNFNQPQPIYEKIGR